VAVAWITLAKIDMKHNGAGLSAATFGRGVGWRSCRHHGRAPVNQIATAAKARTLSTRSKMIAPYLPVTSYPAAYALESLPVGLFIPPRAPTTIPIVINNANDRMANRTLADAAISLQPRRANK
jgi:hypothetical protein